jgi:ribosome-associated protein
VKPARATSSSKSAAPALDPGVIVPSSGAGLASLCAKFADDKKAVVINVLDVRGIASFADYLVVCAGTSDPHLKAIASGIEDSLRKDFGLRAYRSDGIPASQWIVLDFVDVVVHVFREETRLFYGIEDLWSDAAKVDWEKLSAKLVS